MDVRAAVAVAAGKPLEVTTVQLEGPREGEVLVEIKATGICHTDEFTLSGADPEGPRSGLKSDIATGPQSAPCGPRNGQLDGGDIAAPDSTVRAPYLPMLRSDAVQLSNDASESDMACRGIDRFRMPRGRAIPAAIVWGAQM
jgi:hypothetical protein